MKKIFLPVLFALFFSINGFSQAQETSSSKSDLFSVSGSVISKPDKNFLNKATVKIQKFTTNPIELAKNQFQTIQTDSNGRWSVKNLAAGEYKVIISPPVLSDNDKEKGENRAAKLATVAKMVKIDTKDIWDLVIELPLESTIAGSITVKGESRNANFTYIIATDESQGIVSGSEISEKKFNIKNLSEGNFFLNLTIDDDYHVESIKVGNENITNSTINLKDGQNIKNFEIIVSNEVGNIKGKVNGFKEDEGTLIVLLPIKNTAQNSLRSSMPEVPDENGEFDLQAPTGEYFVAVVTRADMARRDQNNLEIWFKEITKNAQKIFVNANQTVNLELNMPK